MALYMDNILLKDLYRYEGKRCELLRVQLKYRFFVPGFVYVYYFRKSQQSSLKVFKLWYLLMLRITSYITHIQIPHTTKIGEGLYIGHFGTIVINPDSVIGKNFSIAAEVLIGNSHGRKEGVPVIGDNVRMGQFSVIVGGVKIGNDVLIAPGAFVNFDVPDNSIVIGNPGKIIRKSDSPTSKYMVYPV